LIEVPTTPEAGRGSYRLAEGSPQADVIAVKKPAIILGGNFGYQDFFENGGVALHLVSADGLILLTRRSSISFGYPAEDYVGHHITEFFPTGT